MLSNTYPGKSGWVYSGLVARTPPVLQPRDGSRPAPRAGGGPDRRRAAIGISLSRQHLWSYDGGSLVFEADATTGVSDKSTPVGVYAIQAKIPNFEFVSPWPPSSPYWYPDSPAHFAMQFLADDYYSHDAPWRPYYGPGTNFPHLNPDGTVRQGSHGCLTTTLPTIQFLAPWTPIGAPVNIVA